MARVRRAALAALALGLGTPGRTVPPDLLLSVPAGPGSLLIANPGPAPVDIAAAIRVERRDGGAWTPVLTEFAAVAACGRADGAATTRIPGGGRLAVVPWRGFSCDGQCPRPCRGNIYHGAGPFRFVVLQEPGHRPVAGPVFAMPARPVAVARPAAVGPVPPGWNYAGPRPAPPR